LANSLTDHAHRDFVKDYWPSSGIPGDKIKDMYGRIARENAQAALQEAPTEKVQGATAKSEELGGNGP